MQPILFSIYKPSLQMPSKILFSAGKMYIKGTIAEQNLKIRDILIINSF